MKPLLLKTIAAGLLSAFPLNAAITGQWDFNTGYDASIGQEIVPLDAGTEAGTEFGTTTSFGIPNIAGEVANVMKFDKPPEWGGYSVPTGAAGNGGGWFVNQFTIIMDVLFPEESSNKRRALVATDYVRDAQYTVQADNGIWAGGSSAGNIQPNTWYPRRFCGGPRRRTAGC